MRMLPNSRQPVSNFCNIFIFYTIRQESPSFEWLSHIAQEGQNMSRVAQKVGLERTHLYRKLKQLGISVSRRSAAEKAEE